jgi:hypothetical protein
MNYKLRQFLRLPITIKNEIKWAYQRATRGFSDRDWWSLDSHIANVLSKALPLYIEKGHGVNASYFEGEDYDDDEGWKKAEEKRDEEYRKYADIFARYADGGVWQDEITAKELNGITPNEYEDAMEWLSKHFSGLWD